MVAIVSKMEADEAGSAAGRKDEWSANGKLLFESAKLPVQDSS